MDASTKRIVLLGKTGSGKSSLANTILGQEVFTVNHSSESETSKCKAETGSVDKRSITLIDTPGFFDTNMSEDKLRAEILKCIVECAPGPHAFVILLKVEKFSEHEVTIIKKAEEYFSEEVCKYATVVFTHGDQLQVGQKIEDFLGKNQSLMKKFAGGCHVVDNRYWNTENPKHEYRSNKFQVKQLLKSVDEIIKKNKGGCFTNEMLRKVKKEIQKEKDLIRPSSGKMPEEEIEKRAKKNVFKKLWILFAGTSTGVLLGALMGVCTMVLAVVEILTGSEGAAGTLKVNSLELQTKLPPGVSKAATELAPKIAVAAVAVSAAVGGVKGGLTGYSAAVDAETPWEAVKKAAKAVTE